MVSGPLSPSVAPGNMYGNFKGQTYQGGQSEPAGSKTCFTYEELMDITNGFSYDTLIGEGGFGSVYKGMLPDGKAVAIKQLKAGGGQGEKEFRAEVDVISRVHHRHLVSLVGYCLAEHRRMLVFEFLPNKTLEHHLHGTFMKILPPIRLLEMDCFQFDERCYVNFLLIRKRTSGFRMAKEIENCYWFCSWIVLSP